jgi:hypothetical protein
MKITCFITRWPIVQQILTPGDRMRRDAMSQRTHNLAPKHHGAEVARSVCPYCAVGCGQLVYHKGGKLVSIEGDPQSPISRGRLCPKGSDSFELLTHAGRETRVKYRRPRSTKWQELSLEGDEHDRGPHLGIAGAHVCGREKRRNRDAHHRNCTPRRRDCWRTDRPRCLDRGWPSLFTRSAGAIPNSAT